MQSIEEVYNDLEQNHFKIPRFFRPYKDRTDIKSAFIRPFYHLYSATVGSPVCVGNIALGLLGTAVDICLLDFPCAWTDFKSAAGTFFDGVLMFVLNLLLMVASSIAIATRASATVVAGVVNMGKALSDCLFGESDPPAGGDEPLVLADQIDNLSAISSIPS